MGEFKTNFTLPNYIGIGNGITRGYGAIYGVASLNDSPFDENELNKSEIEDFDENSILVQNIKIVKSFWEKKMKNQQELVSL